MRQLHKVILKRILLFHNIDSMCLGFSHILYYLPNWDLEHSSCCLLRVFKSFCTEMVTFTTLCLPGSHYVQYYVSTVKSAPAVELFETNNLKILTFMSK